MAHAARVEELSDSDSDPPEMDLASLDPSSNSSVLTPSYVPSTSVGGGEALQPQFRAPTSDQTAQRERSKHWQCLYPIYFDASRTRAEGRRVGKNQAVDNPLARELVDAVASLGLNVVFEPGKTHPKDWANPGRVRVLLKEDGKTVARNVTNKHHLYNLVSAYLKEHPTDEDSPFRLRIAGVPPPPKPVPPPAVPKGWKVNAILPLHSPAITGGGVSENLQDLLPGGPGAPPGIGGGEGPKGKGKKKGKG